MPSSIFHGFIGQKREVGFLGRLIDGAKSRVEPCPHLLLAGGSGLGKTALASALATHYGTPCRVIQCSRDFSPVSLADTSSEWLASDYIFFDEAHALTPYVQEMLFLIIDKNEVPVASPLADDKARRIIGRRLISPVTLILATDQPGKLLPALKKRIPLIRTLMPYGENDLIDITRQIATGLNLVLSAQAARLLAEGARGTPRRVKHQLHALRQFYQDSTVLHFTVEHIREFYSAQGVDSLGLTPDDRAYLTILGTRNGDALSLGSISSILRFDQQYVLRDIEPWLIEHNFISIVAAGRCLTPKGSTVYSQFSVGDAL